MVEVYCSVFTTHHLALSNMVAPGHIESTPLTLSSASSNEAIVKWLEGFEMRQEHRNAIMHTRLVNLEQTLFKISSQLAHGQPYTQSLGKGQNDNCGQSTDKESSEIHGPSAQSLIEHGIMAGWSMQSGDSLLQS